MEKQFMLDGTLVPVGPHRDDRVVCSDGTECARHEALADVNGGLHYYDEDRREANQDIVNELIDACCAGADEYTEHEDYGNGYAHCVRECHHNWADRIDEWLDGQCVDYSGDVRKAMVESIGQLAYDFDEFEAIHCRNEYADYSGEGCCLDSMEIGEIEEQVDIDGVPAFVELHEAGELEGHLEDYNGDACLYCNDRYDAASGRRVKTGYVSGNCFSFHTMPGGQWHYVVSKETMDSYLTKAIVEYCERVDGNG